MTDQRRLAIVLPDLRAGGAERWAVNLANEWANRGYLVDLVLMRRRGELVPAVSSHVKVLGLRAKRLRHVVLPLRSYLARARPHATLVAMWPLTSIAVVSWLLSGKKGLLFVTDHNQLGTAYREQKNSRRWLRSTISLTYPLASGIVAVSKGVRAEIGRLGKIPDQRIRVIYNPAAISREESCRETSEAPNWKPLAGPKILSIGTLKAQKDHRTLIQAFARLPAALGGQLAILGDGPLKGELTALASELGVGDRIILPGFQRNPSEWLAGATVFVLSSRWEGFGNVIVEALSLGVPVVSTDCPSGPAEILANGEYGRLVAVGDPDALAEAIKESVEAIHDSSKLIQRSKEFSTPKIASQYLEYMFADPHA